MKCFGCDVLRASRAECDDFSSGQVPSPALNTHSGRSAWTACGRARLGMARPCRSSLHVSVDAIRRWRRMVDGAVRLDLAGAVTSHARTTGLVACPGLLGTGLHRARVDVRRGRGLCDGCRRKEESGDACEDEVARHFRSFRFQMAASAA